LLHYIGDKTFDLLLDNIQIIFYQILWRLHISYRKFTIIIVCYLASSAFSKETSFIAHQQEIVLFKIDFPILINYFSDRMGFGFQMAFNKKYFIMEFIVKLECLVAGVDFFVFLDGPFES